MYKRQVLFVRQSKPQYTGASRNVAKRWKLGGTLARSYRRNILAGAKYYCAVKKFKPAVVHIAGHSLARIPSILNFDIPLVASCDGTEYQSLKMGTGESESVNTKAWRSEKKLLQTMSEIHCTSEWSASSVIDDFQVERNKVCVTPYSILPQANKRLSVESENFLPNVMFVGNDFTRKGAKELVSLHQKKFKHRFHLHIFSKEMPSDLTSENVSVHNNVTHTELIDRWYPRMDVFILPSKYDQTPYAVIEALSFGLPVIVTDVGGLPELVRFGEAGIVVPKNDKEELARAIDSVLENDSLRISLSSNALNHFESRYSSKIIVPKFIDRLVEIGNSHNGANNANRH